MPKRRGQCVCVLEGTFFYPALALGDLPCSRVRLAFLTAAEWVLRR